MWECAHGGQVWTEPASTAASTDAGKIPPGFCSVGVGSLNTAFTVGLLIDIGFQVSARHSTNFGTNWGSMVQIYMLFMTWRFSRRWQHYSSTSRTMSALLTPLVKWTHILPQFTTRSTNRFAACACVVRGRSYDFLLMYPLDEYITTLTYPSLRV